jgi:hypothetical protein
VACAHAIIFVTSYLVILWPSCSTQATKHSPSYNLNSTILVPHTIVQASPVVQTRFQDFHLVFTGSTSHYIPVLLLSVVVRTPSGFLRRHIIHILTHYACSILFYAHFVLFIADTVLANLRQV